MRMRSGRRELGFCDGARRPSRLIRLQQPDVTAADDFGHGGEIVLAFDGFHFELAVIGAVGPAVLETDERGDGESAADVGDVEAFDARGRAGQAERARRVRRGLFAVRWPAAGCRGRARRSWSCAWCRGGRRGRRGTWRRARNPGRARPFSFRLRVARAFRRTGRKENRTRRDLLEVLFAGDVADARGGAEFQIAVEAMLVIALVGRERAAAAQMELAADEVRACCAGRRNGRTARNNARRRPA